MIRKTPKIFVSAAGLAAFSILVYFLNRLKLVILIGCVFELN